MDKPQIPTVVSYIEPLRKAYAEYCQSEDYQRDFARALHPSEVDGMAFSAFAKGFKGALTATTPPPEVWTRKRLGHFAELIAALMYCRPSSNPITWAEVDLAIARALEVELSEP